MDILIYLIFLIASIIIFYYLIKTAVKNGTKEALLENNIKIIKLLTEINKNVKKKENKENTGATYEGEV